VWLGQCQTLRPEPRSLDVLRHFVLLKIEDGLLMGKTTFYLNTKIFTFNQLYHLMAVWLSIRKAKTSECSETTLEISPTSINWLDSCLLDLPSFLPPSLFCPFYIPHLCIAWHLCIGSTYSDRQNHVWKYKLYLNILAKKKGNIAVHTSSIFCPLMPYNIVHFDTFFIEFKRILLSLVLLGETETLAITINC